MRVHVSADMEGVTGLAGAADVQPGGRDRGRGRSMMAEDMDAAVRGALAAGAHEILVHDAHGPTRDLRPDDPHPRAACAGTTEWGPPVAEVIRTARRRSTAVPMALPALPGVAAEHGRTIRATGQPPSLQSRFGVWTRIVASLTGWASYR
ncbi:hypothetical protein CQW39_36305 [Streptomyces griseofuscus]|uniref:M55 family metallopeptidase n=1 Tax=Streptomyces griseofuscus TaxID=146922 RepID=UPI000F653792|nr:M55 family metallopeptidase [Streptomyces griseofuscus]RRQ68951.1 hypothetical protein CQW39_36305 [Streptomyces griseofuscus]